MAFDDIPEDKELSFPCTCGGNIKKHDGKWGCDSCDWKQDGDDCDQISDMINSIIITSSWSSGGADCSTRSGIDILKCITVGSTHSSTT
jgi:hypothetical protein